MRWLGPGRGCRRSSTSSRPARRHSRPTSTHRVSPRRAGDEARRALDEAHAVVDGSRAEFDAHAAAVTAPATGPAAATPRRDRARQPAASGGVGWVGGSRLREGLGGGLGSGLGGGLGSCGWRGRPVIGRLVVFGRGGSPRRRLVRPWRCSAAVSRSTLPDGSTASAPNAVAASAVRHALTQLGVPYHWGGTTPGVSLGLQRADAVGVSRSGTGPSATGPGAGRRRGREPRRAAPGRPRGVGRSRGDDRRQRADDRSGRSRQAVPDSNHQRGSGFSGLLAADGVKITPLVGRPSAPVSRAGLLPARVGRGTRGRVWSRRG